MSTSFVENRQVLNTIFATDNRLPKEVMFFCPACKTFETVCFNRGVLIRLGNLRNMGIIFTMIAARKNLAGCIWRYETTNLSTCGMHQYRKRRSGNTALTAKSFNKEEMRWTKWLPPFWPEEKGTRMDIFCHVRPKPTLPFAGKYRFIDFSLSNCVHSQINDITLLVWLSAFAPRELPDAMANRKCQESNISILEPENNGSYCGTANAIYQKLDYFQQHLRIECWLCQATRPIRWITVRCCPFMKNQRLILLSASCRYRLRKLTGLEHWPVGTDGNVNWNMLKNPMCPEAIWFRRQFISLIKIVLAKRLYRRRGEVILSSLILVTQLSPGWWGMTVFMPTGYDGFCAILAQ